VFFVASGYKGHGISSEKHDHIAQKFKKQPPTGGFCLTNPGEKVILLWCHKLDVETLSCHLADFFRQIRIRSG
jgi:hypothetical protein